MKKIVFIALFSGMMIASFLQNSNLTDNEPAVISLASLVSTAHAQDECNEPTCVPNDCPWWNPFCDDYDGADPDTTWETCGICVCYVIDCYPGTGSCSEGSGIVCEPM